MQRKVLDAIQGNATRRFLTGIGYILNMVYAPKQLGGTGMQRLYTTQGVRNLTQMLKHIRANSTVWKLFMIETDWLQAPEVSRH